MAQVDVSISLDIAAVLPMLEQFVELASRLGIDEVERRIGRPIDEAYIQGLVAIEEAGRFGTHLRVVPTAEFELAMAALSGSASLARAISFS